MTPYIAADAVAKRFPSDRGAVDALAGVSLSLERGEFVSLVGPSGCGKSTLLRIVGGLIPASEGSVAIDGAPVRAPRDDVGIVFQRPVLLPWRSVLGNVLLPLDIAHEKARGSLDRAQGLLDLVGLQGFARSLPGQLSGGMQQRVAICRALIRSPQILLMDEPFGALDAITREQMGVELLRIWSEVKGTVLFITHSIPEAVFLSDRVAVMSSRPGRILEVVDVPLPRPRTLAMLGDPTLAALSTRLRTLVEAGHAGSGAGAGTRRGGEAGGDRD
jgi:NitT/TauT family transport system ATP-binding protein